MAQFLPVRGQNHRSNFLNSPDFRVGVRSMTMARLLYSLEDHFDALADRRSGQFSGWVSRCLSNAFAVLGDVCQVNVDMRRSQQGFRRTTPSVFNP